MSLWIGYSFWAKLITSNKKVKESHTPYDESKYLEALKRRGLPLLKLVINS